MLVVTANDGVTFEAIFEAVIDSFPISVALCLESVGASAGWTSVRDKFLTNVAA